MFDSLPLHESTLKFSLNHLLFHWPINKSCYSPSALSSVADHTHFHSTMANNPETNRQRRETNPHFRPLQPPPPQHGDQHSQTPQPRHQDQHTQPPQPRQQGQTNPHFKSLQSPPQDEDQHFQPPQPRQQGQHSQPDGQQVPQPQHQGQQPSAKVRQPKQRSKQWSSPWAEPRSQDQQPSGPRPWGPPPQHQGQQTSPWVKLPPQGQPPSTQPTPKPVVQPPQHQDQQTSGPSQPQHQGQQSSGSSPRVTVPQRQGQQPSPWVKLPPQGQHPQTHSQPEDQGHLRQPQRPDVLPQQHQRHRSGPQMPRPRSTRCITWFGGIFCAIFWVVIFLGGLAVLIVYLVFRPRSPRFDISSATLNAAYLDMGYLLNSDLTVLANFTNPNKKVSVDFSYVTLDLYHGNTLIATQYIEPFKAAKQESLFADVHMVTSQVQLPLRESEQLQKQIDNSRVLFEIKGVFHARSILGNFLGYSYRLYTHCNIVVTGPPGGVLRASKCRTKR